MFKIKYGIRNNLNNLYFYVAIKLIILYSIIIEFTMRIKTVK